MEEAREAFLKVGRKVGKKEERRENSKREIGDFVMGGVNISRTEGIYLRRQEEGIGR